MLARKLVHFHPGFKHKVEQALKLQYANGLHDKYNSAMAHSLLQQNQRASFTKFCSILATVCGGHTKKPKATAVTTSEVSGSEENNESGGMSKHQKQHQKQKIQTQAINDLQNKLDAAIAENQQVKEILRPESLRKAIAQAVNSSSTKGTLSAFGKPFLGTPRPPQLMPGFDGSLDPSLECKYCKDKGHNVFNCKKVKLKEERARVAQTQSVLTQTPN